MTVSNRAGLSMCAVLGHWALAPAEIHVDEPREANWVGTCCNKTQSRNEMQRETIMEPQDWLELGSQCRAELPWYFRSLVPSLGTVIGINVMLDGLID